MHGIGHETPYIEDAVQQTAMAARKPAETGHWRSAASQLTIIVPIPALFDLIRCEFGTDALNYCIQARSMASKRALGIACPPPFASLPVRCPFNSNESLLPAKTFQGVMVA